MMAEHTTITCDEFLDLAAAVALDAADADDLRKIEEHAETCPDCRVRLDEFRETAAALGALVAQAEPPVESRARLMDAVAREPRSRPVIRRLLPRRRPSPAWLVAAASFVLAFGALIWVALLQSQIADLQRTVAVATDRSSRFDRVVKVLASDQLAVRPLEPAVQTLPSGGYVFLDPASGTGMLMCHNLPPVAQGHAYQIWFVRGTERVSAGMLWPDTSGDGYTIIRLPPDVQSFDSLGLTDEPGDGSQWPTSPRVIGTALKVSSQ